MHIKTLLCLFISIQSAITVCAQSYPNTAYAVAGDTIYLTRDSLTNSNYDFSITGQNATWNYAGLTGSSQRRLIFRNPNQTGFSLLQWPYIYSSNNTNLSSTFGGQVAIGSLEASNFNDYYKKTTNYLEEKASAYTIYFRSSGLNIKSVWSSPDTIYHFPLQYSNKDSSTGGFTTSIPGIYYQDKKIYRHNLVDGTGTLTTPYGVYANCLRLVSMVTEVDSIRFNDSVSFKTTLTYREIKWFSAAKHYQLLTVRQQMIAGIYINQYADYFDKEKFFPPQPLFAYYPLLPQIGDTVLFQNLSSNSTSCKWDFGDAASGTSNTSTDQNPSHIFSKPGTYTVKLICYNGPLKDSVSLAIKVNTGNFIWTGAVDTHWDNPANWDRNLVPDACDAIVEIPATTIQPVITIPVSVGNLQLNAGSNLKAKVAVTICGKQ